jgi:hypothetical protein
MSGKWVVRLAVLVVLGAFAILSGCSPTDPTIGCDVDELIAAMEDANANPDHDEIIMVESCNYQLGENIFEVPPPNDYTDLGDVGLPPITTPITISGNGSRIFRPTTAGTPEYRIFYVGPSGDLELVDLYLENGYETQGGGAIRVDEGRLALGQCVLMNSHSVSGGAIFNGNGGRVVVRDSVLRNNSAGFEGGAIWNFGGTVEIDSYSVIDHNEADFGGSAIYFDGGDLSITNSTIRANSSGRGGSAIRLDGGTASLQHVNIADNQGAGISFSGTSLTISDSQIRKNQARRGAGLYLHNGDVTIDQGTRIYENIADEYGGGIYISYLPTVTLEDCTITDNQAGIAGGGIGNSPDQHDPTISLSKCTISGNSTAGQGGGLYIHSGAWDIDASTISENTASEGGGIYNHGFLKMLNSTISSNRADRGGGLLHDSPAVANLSFLTLVENTATSSGGGLQVDSTYVHITNSLVAENAPRNCQGATQPFPPNLDDDESCGFDIIAKPLLQPLGDYGGPTHTHAIPPASPAVDMAPACTPMNVSVPVDADQRGVGRPQGADCDLGAYEAPGQELVPIIYTCVRVRGVTTLDDGRVRIQVETPDLPEGEYQATVGEEAFACQTIPEYPDRLFCDGPPGQPDTFTTLTIFDPDGDAFCTQRIDFPPDEQDKPRPPSTKYQGCWWSKNPTQKPSCVVPCPNDAYSGAGCNP